MALACRRSLNRSELIIDGKSVGNVSRRVKQRREVLRRVILEVAAFFINLFKKELVDFRRVAEQSAERRARRSGCRITVTVKI